jgi:hypothetical protein
VWAKRARFKKDGDDNLETEEQYTERMCGIIALYAAILQTTSGIIFTSLIDVEC